MYPPLGNIGGAVSGVGPCIMNNTNKICCMFGSKGLAALCMIYLQHSEPQQSPWQQSTVQHDCMVSANALIENAIAAATTRKANTFFIDSPWRKFSFFGR